jgi:phosphatidylglycerophosphate synthase
MEQHDHISDRRPIAARSWPVWTAVARRLARSGITPNQISVAGMAAGVLAGAALASTAWSEGIWIRCGWLAGAVLIQLRLLANLLDGMVAVEGGLRSAEGELYNEVPDRVSDSAVLMGVGWAVGGDPLLGLGAALAAMFTAYVRVMGKAAGAKMDFCGPMAKQHRMALVTGLGLFCGIAPAAWNGAWTAWAGVGLPAVALIVVIAGSIGTALRRLGRIVRQLRELAQQGVNR